MAGDCFAPIDICGVQINGLDTDGSILDGPTDRVVACNMVNVSRSPDVEAGRTDLSRNGGGTRNAKRVIPDRINGWDIQINLSARYDVEMLELLGVYSLVVDSEDVTGGSVGDSVGIKAKSIADEPCICVGATSSFVSMLIWQQNTGPDGVNSTKPYVVMALPKIRFTVTGEDRGDTYNNLTLTGVAEANSNWTDTGPGSVVGRGPGNIYPETGGLDVAWAEWATSQAPPGGCNCDFCGFASGLVANNPDIYELA